MTPPLSPIQLVHSFWSGPPSLCCLVHTARVTGVTKWPDTRNQETFHFNSDLTLIKALSGLYQLISSV